MSKMDMSPRYFFNLPLATLMDSVRLAKCFRRQHQRFAAV